jgi:hypothetical protein
MELTPGQQKAVFAAVVVVLAGLGISLFVPHGAGKSGTSDHGRAGQRDIAHPASSSAPAALPAGPTASPASAAPGALPPSAAPQASPHVNIYKWLPFTQQDLARAAAVTTRFGADYGTFSYTQSAARYVAAMNGLITGELAQTLQNAYATPGVAALRSRQKQVSSGTAVIDSLRAFGPSSITFVVTVNQKLTTTRGTSNSSTQYAVTATNAGGSWQVSDIELASAGNQ